MTNQQSCLMTRAKLMDQPGHRFHPTEKELVDYFLPHKVRGNHSHVSAIAENDNIHKHEPWDLAELANSSSKDICYIFSPRDSERMKRLTKAGFWKVTGKKRKIINQANQMIIKRYLVFFTGRANKAEWTNWAMHEYYLKPSSSNERGYALYCLHQKPPKKSVNAAVDEGEPGRDSAFVVENPPVTDISSSEIDQLLQLVDDENFNEQDCTIPTEQQLKMHVSHDSALVVGNPATDISSPEIDVEQFMDEILNCEEQKFTFTSPTEQQNNISELRKSYSASIHTAPSDPSPSVPLGCLHGNNISDTVGDNGWGWGWDWDW